MNGIVTPIRIMYGYEMILNYDRFYHCGLTDTDFSFIDYQNVTREQLEALRYHSWYDFSNMPNISDDFDSILAEVLNLLPHDIVFIDNRTPLTEVIKRKFNIEMIPLDADLRPLDEGRYFIHHTGGMFNNAREMSTAINVLERTSKSVAFCGTFPVIKDSESFYNPSTEMFSVYGEPHYYLQDRGNTMSHMLLERDYKGRVLPNISLFFLRAFLRYIKKIDVRFLRANKVARMDEITLAFLLEPTFSHVHRIMREDVFMETLINRMFNIGMTTKLTRLFDDI